jgi:hypothetical protein
LVLAFTTWRSLEHGVTTQAIVAYFGGERREIRDPFAGTPWHKYVPNRIERVSAKQEAAA